MNNAQFADMYAKTIAYGMFVARLQEEFVDGKSQINLTPCPSPKERGEIAQHQLEPLIKKELSQPTSPLSIGEGQGVR